MNDHDLQQKQHIENQRKLDELLQLSKTQDKRMDAMEKKIDPMYLIFSNIRSANSVLIWILKALILLGTAIAAVGGIYEGIKWVFRN
jgi:hypothetical protein